MARAYTRSVYSVRTASISVLDAQLTLVPIPFSPALIIAQLRTTALFVQLLLTGDVFPSRGTGRTREPTPGMTIPGFGLTGRRWAAQLVANLCCP